MSEQENVRALLTFKGQYHNHKETLAHAAVVLQLGVLAAMIALDPPKEKCYCEGWFLVCYIIVWGVISVYAGWQLSKRHKAANQIGKLIEYMSKNEKTDISNLIKEVGGGAEGLWINYIILGFADLVILIISIIWILVIW